MTDIFVNPAILENGEIPIPIGEAHLHFPIPTCPSNIQIWIRGGFGGVRLGTFTSGRLRYTSKEEIRRFLLAQQSPGAPAQAKVPKSASRPNSATMTNEDIDSELRRFGFSE